MVFSTKYRRKLILPKFRENLYQYIGGIIRENDGVLLEIGGIEEHVHLMAGLPSTIAVSDMLRLIKTNSSAWVNKSPGSNQRFAWQPGFGAFTVGYSQKPIVRNYIQNQEKHHTRISFKDEFLAILAAHEISYEPKYVFEDEHFG